MAITKTSSVSGDSKSSHIQRTMLNSVVVRFSGDSGDGIQVAGNQFTLASALSGNDFMTFPDFPAEIRAPAGTSFGVSSFQIHFGTDQVQTPGDSIDVLIALNPAALKVNLPDLRKGGLILLDIDSFTERDLARAGYTSNPLDDLEMGQYRLLSLPLSSLTIKAVKSVEAVRISNKEAHRARNIWAIGLILWMFDRPSHSVAAWIEKKFSSRPEQAQVNLAVLQAGFAYGHVAGCSPFLPSYHVPPAHMPEGTYRNVTGTESLCWGLIAGSICAGIPLNYCSYPITPASPMLHLFSGLDHQFNVVTFQAEDEIAAICAAIGASYAGRLGVTGSSGPGMALKTEAIGLAIATELPLVIINAQRGGPSTGLPTKTEQSDLYQALWGRNGDAALPVLAPHSPGDCFDLAREAIRIAIKFMTPVIILTDGYIANAAEPWRIPDMADLPSFPVRHLAPNPCLPYERDEKTLARPWIIPGTAGSIHRIGGLERQSGTGNISYDPQNHEKMTHLRCNKILGIANDIPEQKISRGASEGSLLILGWGSTFGAIDRATALLIEEGYAVSHLHLRYIWPFPLHLGTLLQAFDSVLVPEMNMGQLATALRAHYGRSIDSLSKVTGRPFTVAEIVIAVKSALEKPHNDAPL